MEISQLQNKLRRDKTFKCVKMSILVFFLNFRYATVKKEPITQPHVPARHRKRSSKSTKSFGTIFTDSPFPERHKRGQNNAAPSRPPRRGSSSSLIDPNK